tara:strand:- start:131 stop:985 length:855 start_codon:yes stop_codon:yes gene_type:complete
MNTENQSNPSVQTVKRGRPRRLEARVVGGDDLISALACGVGVLSVEGERVGGEEAGVRKMLDDSSMLLEREQMGECDVEERERVRLERRVAREEEKKRLRESEKAAKEAARSEARVLKAAEKKVELEERKAAKAAERSAKKAEKEAAREEAKAAKAAERSAKKAEKEAEKVAAKEAAKAAKVAAKEAAKAAKKAAKEAAKAAKKAAKEAEKKTNKTNKTKKTKSAAPELLAAVADCDLYCCNGELVPQAFLVDSEASADVPMMKQPSTGYEAAPMRSGDSFCDP